MTITILALALFTGQAARASVRGRVVDSVTGIPILPSAGVMN